MKWFDDIRKYYLYRGLIKRYVVPILSIYLLDQGLTLEQIGITIAVATGIQLVFEVPSGTLADLIGHKRSIALGCLGQGVSMLLYIVLDGFVGMMIATVTYWVTSTLMTGTHDAILYELLERRGEAQKYKTYYGRAFAFANILSAALLATSAFVYVWNPTVPFLIGIAQFVFAAWLISSLSDVPETHSVKKEEGYAGFLKSFRQNRSAYSLK
jgi:MFS family permease